MRTRNSTIICTILLAISSCRQPIERDLTDTYEYFDLTASDTIATPMLFAVTDEEFMQYGARVAYVNSSGDTIIPFGKYAYYGTDTLVYYANVIESPNDSTVGREVGINRDQKVLF